MNLTSSVEIVGNACKIKTFRTSLHAFAVLTEVGVVIRVAMFAYYKYFLVLL